MALISVKCTKTETEYIYAKGENGKSILSGNNPPDANFGNNGDFFIDLSSFNLYGPKNNGNWGQPIANLKGVDGKDGITPKINIKDGYWTINGERTNQKAILDAPTISISEDGFWIINNEKTNKKAIGENGVTPKIEIKDGFWYINDIKTNQKAQGEKGNDGKDGVTPTIEIENGYWKINGKVFNIKAIGNDGQKGKDGTKITISTDGYWEFDGVKSEHKAIAESGTKIYSGTTNPENNLGKEGDFYLQTETKTIYGPKTNSGWGEGITLTNNPIFKEGIDYNLSNDKTTLLKWLNQNTKHINMNTDPKLRKVTKIEKLAFSDDNNPLQLTSIVISKNVKEIGEYTFRNCTKLKSIELPDGLTKISDGTFMNCIRLESIDIPDSVTNIGKATFENCFFISSIIISKNVKEIGINAFSNCHQLTSVYLEPLTPPTLKRSPFDTNSIKIYVKGNEVKQKYEKAPIWKNFTIKDLNF